MIVLDTSVLVAYFRVDEAGHEPIADWLDAESDGFVTTPLAVAEMDHLIGDAGRPDLLRTLRDGALRVEWWPEATQETVYAIEAQGRADVGLTDMSLVVLAARVRSVRVATLDERHFRTLRPLTGEPAFRLLPADAQPQS